AAARAPCSTSRAATAASATTPASSATTSASPSARRTTPPRTASPTAPGRCASWSTPASSTGSEPCAERNVGPPAPFFPMGRTADVLEDRLMHARRALTVAATTAGLAGLLASPGATAAQAQGGQERVLPGPAILHQAPVTATQLTNAAPWMAPPILVSGAHAYEHGEFLYQDFLYDDTGANGNLYDPNDKRPAPDAFSLRTGTYSYPSDPRYLGNAADLVELRVKPLDTATAFRITLTELSDPSLVATTIGIGTPGSAAKQAPDGANVAMPADHFLTVHGTSADYDGTPVAVSFDSNRAQIDVRVPHALWDPGTSTV